SRGSARLVILSAAKIPRPSFDHTIQIELQTVIVRSLTPRNSGFGMTAWCVVFASEFPAVFFRTDCGKQNDCEKNETFHQRHSQGVIGISIRVSKMVGQRGLLLRGIRGR